MTDDTPKKWCEMTDAEKGALLLAHHEGKAIESRSVGDWKTVYYGPNWKPSYGTAYRIRPEPKRETVKRSLHGKNFMGYVAIDMIDDEPQWDTIRRWDDKNDPL